LFSLCGVHRVNYTSTLTHSRCSYIAVLSTSER
jgi:hypothetical protein